jgi:hypothetical protein
MAADIEARIAALRTLLAQLGKNIPDDEARDVCLGPAANLLNDVETLWLPGARNAGNPADEAMFMQGAEFQLGEARTQLEHVQEMIARYGAHLRVIGAVVGG